MKKLFLEVSAIAGMMVCSVSMSSCTQDNDAVENVIPNAQGLIPVKIRGSIGGDSRTKLSDSDSKTVEFQSGDSLAVWDGQGDQKIRRFGTKDGGSVAIFKGSLDENASNLNILYPLQDGATCTGTNITATIPTEQTAVEGNFDPKANLSVTTATYTKGQNVTCTLENVCGLLKFTISEFTLDYDSIRIRAISGTEAQDIAGKAEISASEKKITGIASGGGSKTITLKKKDDANKLSAGKTYYIVMSPQTSIDSLEMTFFQNDMIVGLPMNIAKAGKSSFSINPGVILNLGTVKPAPAFSVSATKKVIFAPGNLWCVKKNNAELWSADNCTWKFADHQWDRFETEGMNVGDNYKNVNTITLFGWGTSGYNHGATCYQPWCTNETNSNYYPYNSSTANLDGGDGAAKGMADWGTANKVALGGQDWHTPGKDDWVYLLKTRDGARYAKATVHNVPGMIIIPDGYEVSGGQTKVGGVTLNSVNVVNAAFADNMIGNDDWDKKFETAGCVFLPCAGHRYGSSQMIWVGTYGYYWSSTAGNSQSYYVYFFSDEVDPQYPYYNYIGRSVRLVRDVAATIPVSLTGGISSGGISSGSFSTE